MLLRLSVLRRQEAKVGLHDVRKFNPRLGLPITFTVPLHQRLPRRPRRTHALFRTHLPPAWNIASYGAYYAFVRHPFAGMDAREVCKRLAEEISVVCLSVAFFLYSEGTGGQVREEDRYVRFSIANVGDEKIRLVCERLMEAEKTFGWVLDA